MQTLNLNAHYNFPEPNITPSNVLYCLFDIQSETRYSIYNNVKTEKSSINKKYIHYKSANAGPLKNVNSVSLNIWSVSQGKIYSVSCCLEAKLNVNFCDLSAFFYWQYSLCVYYKVVFKDTLYLSGLQCWNVTKYISFLSNFCSVYKDRAAESFAAVMLHNGNLAED